MAGLKPGSFTNLKSRFRRALKVLGLLKIPGRKKLNLSAPWRAVFDALPNRYVQAELSRFIQYADAAGWLPEEIDDSCFRRFLFDLDEGSVHDSAKKVLRKARKAWNRYVAAHPDGNAKPVEIEARAKGYTLPWDSFPDSLRQDVEAYLHKQANPSVFAVESVREPIYGGAKRRRKKPAPLRPVTIKLRRFQLLQLLSALVICGIPIASLTSLDAALSVEHVDKGLTFFYDRAGQTYGSQVKAIGLTILTILRYWVRDQERAETVAVMIEPAMTKQTGMTPRNQARLRQFDDPKNARALIQLPKRLLKDAAALRDKKPLRAVRLAQVATFVSILIGCPMRPGNLGALDLGKHLVRLRPGKNIYTHILLAAEDTKNRKPQEFPLLPEVAKFIKLFVEVYRPLMPGCNSTWLFPSTTGGPTVTKEVWRILGTIVLKYTGIKFNPHLARHLCAKLYLRKYPSNHEVIRRVLNQASIDTTRRYYLEPDNDMSVRHFQSTILGIGNGSTRSDDDDVI
jgi:integrase